MKINLICCLATAIIAITCRVVTAGDDFGIPTYPGAKSDSDTQAVCAQPDLDFFKQREASAGLTSAKRCYRTGDSLDKVIGFFKKQKSLTGDKDVTGQGALFCRGNVACGDERIAGTSINITNFWTVPNTTKINNDVLIIITNRLIK
jgi:hypothetical protein